MQIGGPTAAFIPIVLLIIEKHGYSGLILATLMAGGILIAMGFARMGTLIKFIPWPVTSGFTTGIAVSIMATQAVDFLGIQAQSPPPRHSIRGQSYKIRLDAGEGLSLMREMARRPRQEYAGAIYRVTSGGNYRKELFEGCECWGI